MEIIASLEKFLLDDLFTSHDIDKQSILPDEDLLAQGVLDSLGFVKLISFIEKTFDVKVADEDMEPENFKSLRRLSEFIESKQ